MCTLGSKSTAKRTGGLKAPARDNGKRAWKAPTLIKARALLGRRSKSILLQDADLLQPPFCNPPNAIPVLLNDE